MKKGQIKQGIPKSSFQITLPALLGVWLVNTHCSYTHSHYELVPSFPERPPPFAVLSDVFQASVNTRGARYDR